MEIALPQANTGSWVKIEHFHSIVKETRNRTEIQCTNSYFLCWNVHFISAGYENGILQGVPSIGTHFQFQFLTFLMVL